MADPPTEKRRRVDGSVNTDCLVEIFLKWCADVGLILNAKVTVREEGSCHRFGMIAVDYLEEGECVFKIPRSVLLEPNTSAISNTILEFVQSQPENGTSNKWLPLLLTLLYEYTNPKSKWRPYLDLVPSESVLNQPIFWSEEEREYLALIGLKDEVDNDERNIEEGYRNLVLPFMEKYKKYFDPDIHTLALYKRLAGFVMAYSFADNDDISDKPAMVPMADILNHISNNNAHLEFGEEFLSMVTTQTIQKGGEVFNTYGDLDNCNLLRSYGFIEDCPNPYDEVEIPLNVFQHALDLPDKEWQSKMYRFHKQLGDEKQIVEGIYFNVNGCLCSELTLHRFCQVIHSSAVLSDLKMTETGPIKSRSGDHIVNDENSKGKNVDNKDEGIKDSRYDANTSFKGNRSKLSNLVALSGDVTEKGHDGVTTDNSDNEDEVDVWENDSENGQSEGDIDTTGDIGSIDGCESDSDDESDSNNDENGLSWDELQRLPEQWKQTLKRAANICSKKITDLSKDLSKRFNISLETTRTIIVNKVSQGQLTILKKVEELL